MSRWGKPTKNKKRKDPRYFLNEEVEQEQELLEENPAAGLPGNTRVADGGAAAGGGLSGDTRVADGGGGGLSGDTRVGDSPQDGGLEDRVEKVELLLKQLVAKIRSI